MYQPNAYLSAHHEMQGTANEATRPCESRIGVLKGKFIEEPYAEIVSRSPD